MAADPPLADPRLDQRKGAVRIRLGVGLVLISWLPFAQLAIDVTGAGGSDADHLRYLIWTMQVMVGIAGAAVAGKETIDLAKSVGWKRLPRVVWRLMISPDKPIDASRE